MTDPAFLAAVLVGAAAFSIGLSKSGFAGSIGPLATIFMLTALPPLTAVAVQLPLLLAGDVIALALLWRQWDASIVRSVVPGVVVGILAGTLLLGSVPPDILKRVVGCVAIAFGVWGLVARPSPNATARPIAHHRLIAFATGATVGTTSAIAHVGGPPMTMYLLSQRISARTLVATSALVFAIVNVLKLPFYIATGVVDWQVQLHYSWALLCVPLGAVVGRWMLGRIPERGFRVLVLVFLLAGGIALVFT